MNKLQRSPSVHLGKKSPTSLPNDTDVVWFGGKDGRIFCYEAGSRDAIVMSMDKSYVRLAGPPYEGAQGYQGYDPIIVDLGLMSPADQIALFEKIFENK